jgi:transcriptional regulator with XRE-family HTH domain
MDTEKIRRKALAAFLKQKRQERGWSQRDLARYIGSTQNAIYMWETEKATPDTANFDKISALFGLKTWELLQSLDESQQVSGFDLEKVLRAIEVMPRGDLAKVVGVAAQKLAQVG